MHCLHLAVFCRSFSCPIISPSEVWLLVSRITPSSPSQRLHSLSRETSFFPAGTAQMASPCGHGPILFLPNQTPYLWFQILPNYQSSNHTGVSFFISPKPLWKLSRISPWWFVYSWPAQQDCLPSFCLRWASRIRTWVIVWIVLSWAAVFPAEYQVG